MTRRASHILIGISVVVLCGSTEARAATRHWTGNGATFGWATAANWAEGVPVANDDLVFPAGALSKANFNNFPAGTSFTSITLEGNYVLDGVNSISLRGGIVSTGSNAIRMPIILAGGFPVSVVHTVSSSGGQLTLTDPVSGCSAIASCSLRKEGPGTLELRAANTFGGPTIVAEGVLVVSDNLALGDSSATTVLSGASLVLAGVTIDEPLVLNGEG